MPDTFSDPNPSRDAENFRTVPHGTADYGKLRDDAEGFRNLRQAAERRENHTLTVREVARMFEKAGVARIERSIINWCQPNKFGVARLDCYFDSDERKYFITPQSVELAVKEEQAKQATKRPVVMETTRPSSAESSEPQAATAHSREEEADTNALEREILDLKITNRGKDYFIEQLQKEREGFVQERREYVEKLMTSSRRVGELETALKQLTAPGGNASSRLDGGPSPAADSSVRRS